MLTIPAVPDNFYKILIAFGVGFFIYSNNDYDKQKSIYAEKIKEIRVSYTQLDEKEELANFQREHLIRTAKLISARYNIPNPLIETDSALTFVSVLKGPKIQEQYSDSLWTLFDKYKEAIHQVNILKVKHSTLTDTEDAYENILSSLGVLNDQNGEIALLLIAFGMLGVFFQQLHADRVLRQQLQENKKRFERCQSCGKKFSLIRRQGSNANGESNDGYCFGCYEGGVFTNPALTLEDVYQAAKNVIKPKTWWGRWLLKTRLSSLEQWNKNEYS